MARLAAQRAGDSQAQPEEDMDEPEPGRQDHRGHDPLFPVEDQRLQAEPGPAQVAEELAVQQTEDDREGGAGPRDLGHRPNDRARARPPVEQEPHRRQQQPVAHVAQHQTEEHREEHRHVRGRIDRSVAGQRKQLHDRLEGPEDPWVRKHDRSLLTRPLRARDLLDHDGLPELAGQLPPQA